MTTTPWTPAEGSAGELVERFDGQPLMALTRGEVPALVLRQIFDPAHCAALLERFGQRGLLYDPHKRGDGTPHRVDIGTSFGRHRADRQAFFEHSATTHELFQTLFDGYDDPVETMYQALSALAPDKQVKTAREPDGRLYGPAIFRIYHSELGHGPHFDSVAKRTRYLNGLVEELGLEGVRVVTGRAETLGHDTDLRESMDVVVSRAVAPMRVLVELVLPFCRVGGRAVLQKKGDIREELEQADNACRELGGRIIEVKPVPEDVLDGQRVLVVVEKVAATPVKYPRRAGIPAKRPL
ncbi:MAG: class I SAM-dependent methyltransferase [Chloroflexi bacterium]|nr:class I SAM-dependent methyltransferase [Chloroflexota bacterium]